MKKCQELLAFDKECRLLPDERKNQNADSLKLSYDEIEQIASCPIDHSFLTYKKELPEFGWSVKKIWMKEKCVEFVRENSLQRRKINPRSIH